LSSLGHFLKGSSAALGLKQLKGSCEDIQHTGALKDGLSKDEALEKIEELLAMAKSQYEKVPSNCQTDSLLG
jgi:HPt (histidine-containing phosphotransfer) domain-containing protein